MDELVEKVREALTAEYPGAPNGRVRDVPDRRAIRWYTTIGLVDKPLGMRGRTALYGPRHLQQLVAIKRRQAAGRSLADIQVEFSWLSAEQLVEVSRVPERLLTADGAEVPDRAAGAARHRFWADNPVDTAAAISPVPSPSISSPVPVRPVSQPTAVALGGGVILLIPHTVDDRDRDDIATAAIPLLTLLAARGLIDGSQS